MLAYLETAVAAHLWSKALAQASLAHLVLGGPAVVQNTHRICGGERFPTRGSQSSYFLLCISGFLSDALDRLKSAQRLGRGSRKAGKEAGEG